jgi:hypothetical protein
MRTYRIIRLLGFLLALAAFAAGARAEAVPGGMPPGTARVWFMRIADVTNARYLGASPTIFANGMPVGAIPAGTAFYRDLPPGTYRFTVEPYGLPTEQSETVTLAPGMQVYLQVQWAASWQFGYPPREWGSAPNTFVITALSPRLAAAYMPSLTYLGGR